MSDSKPRGQQSAGQPSTQFIWPVNPHPITSDFGPRSSPGGIGSTNHDGVDLGVPDGTPVHVVLDGNVVLAGDGGGYGNYVEVDHGGGLHTFYGHLQRFDCKTGQQVKQGDIIAHSNNTGDSTGPHLHFGVHEGCSSAAFSGTGVDPMEYLTGAKSPPGGDPSTGGNPGGSNSVSGTGNVESIAKSAAFATFLQFSSVEESIESQALQGDRSLMNDKPLFPFVEQLCRASLREFQSMPNGNFFAFYPDYFGGLGHRTPYWFIHDIEVIDGQINLSDDALATHVYVVGDTATFNGTIDFEDKIQTAGVVTVMNAFMADFLNGINSPVLQDGKHPSKQAENEYEKKLRQVPTLADKDKAISFLKKYGARPLYQEAPMVRSPYFELFLAYQTFCLWWSKQFLAVFELTFMPEIFPGGIVAFPDHGIQCYVDEVTHNCSYSDGFTTTISISAPASMRNYDQKGRIIHEGMVRAGIFSPASADPNTAHPNTPIGRD